jgi:hypothetical protein
MSFSDIVPDIVMYFADCNKDRFATIIEPVEFQGEKIYIFDKKFKPIPFNKDPLIKRIIPQINQSLPFVKPKKINGEYVYGNWIPMETEKNGTWL